MRKVVTLRVLECQLDMVQLSVGGDIHRQARPGKVAGIVEADVMFNNRGFRPLRQLQMVAIVRSIDFIAVQALGDVHQQQRFRRALVSLHVNLRHTLRQALGKVQKDLRLHGCRQALALIINSDRITALVGAVAQIRTELAVDKHQAQGIHIQRQCIALRRCDIRPLRDKFSVQQALKRRVLPVLMFTRG